MIEYHNIIPELFEPVLLRGIIVLLSSGMFIFWCKRKALINFQAWALLTAFINLLLLLIDISIYKDYTQFDMSMVRFLYLLLFATSFISMFKLWKLSVKYMPTETKKRKKLTPTRHIYMKGLAFWHTFKNGGNNNEATYQIRRGIKKIADK